MLFQHLSCTVIDDDRELAGKRWVIGSTVRHGRGSNVTTAILVLQPFPTQGRAPRCRSDQETSRSLVRRGPDQVTDALKTKHRIENIERQHRQVMNAV